MNALRQLVRMPVSAAALAVAAAAAAACGSLAPGGSAARPPSPGHASGRAAASSAPPASLAACVTADLKVTLDIKAAGAAAGSSYVPLEFINASGHPCTLSGNPAVTFAAGIGGPQIGTAATAEHDVSPATLTLAAGGIAHAWLQIVDVVNYPATKCKPVQAGGLRVALAAAQPAAFLPHSFQACANRMPGSTVLAVFPVQPGRARQGTAP
jgi:hypothetical protein